MARYRAKTVKGVPLTLAEDYTAMVEGQFIGVITDQGSIVPWHQVAVLNVAPDPPDPASIEVGDYHADPPSEEPST